MSEGVKKGFTSGECNLPVSKDSPFVETMGSMDEFQAKLGWTRVKLMEEGCKDEGERVLKVEMYVSEIMGTLYQEIKWEDGDKKIEELEGWIDGYTKGRVKNLEGFLVPGENELESRLNLCRTACRTAERRVVTLKLERMKDEADNFDENVLGYFNMLSTYLFWMWQSKR